MDKQQLILYGIPTLGGLLALLFVILSLRAGRRQRLVADLPTSKTTGVFIGLVELKGTAEAGRRTNSTTVRPATGWPFLVM